jgi:hypothetical protein
MHNAPSAEAFDKAQEMILKGEDRDTVEMALIKQFPDLNTKGLIPTILRRAYRDLAEL